MKIKDMLIDAGVPEHFHADVINQFSLADNDSDGMLWHKIKVRYLRTKDIGKLFRPDVERLIDIDPKYLPMDVVPVDSVTCNGDNNLWGYRYIKDGHLVWLNHDLPENHAKRDELISEGYTTDNNALSIPVGLADPINNPNYQAEKDRSYWTKKKHHQRTAESWKIWYRRNGGEGYAWMKGLPVKLDESKDMWVGKNFTVYRIGNVFQISGSKKLLGKLALNYSLGYELANVWDFKKNAQRHKPISGYELKAALTWSILPGKLKKQG